HALTHPAVGVLLILLFAQQLAFGGFEQLLALFTLSRLGLNASGNAAVFVFVGLIIVAVQGGFVGKWSRKYGDRKLVLAGLLLLCLGLGLTALTPMLPPPWYQQAAVTLELSGNASAQTHGLAIALPPDANTGWLGLAWLLLAMIPTAIGGAMLQPTLNSLITKRVAPTEVGGILGVSIAMLSLANAIAPILGGAIFQFAGASAPFWAWAATMGSPPSNRGAKKARRRVWRARRQDIREAYNGKSFFFAHRFFARTIQSIGNRPNAARV
ncbi:MAG: hypothetical protein DCC52_18425, partial [Chloroflexi bacterium]